MVRRFVGHGIGSTLHEKPEVPNYVVTTKPALPLKTGMVLCIEPMITVGTPEVEILDDKWSAVTRDRSLAALLSIVWLSFRVDPRYWTFLEENHVVH